MDYSKFLNEANSKIPADIAKKLKCGGNTTPITFQNLNQILTDPSLHAETGYVEMADGNYLVAMYCPMPGVTKEMIDWWFWWHPQVDERYQLWFPGEHFKNSYASKNKQYFRSKKQPAFQENIQYPVERIGDNKMPLSIEFLTPEHFGFDTRLMKNAQVETIVCGHVGAYKGMIQHTEMAHIFFKREDGLYMVSRFWIGERAKNKLIRKVILKEDTARGMAAHCCIEYRNLAHKLPELYGIENE